MTIEDFNQVKDTKWVSNDKFFFENDKVSFWYRIVVDTHTYQDWGNSDYKTKYIASFQVDDESIHESKRDSIYNDLTCSFFLKETIKKGKADTSVIEKIATSAMNLKIENKIKDRKYQKILGIVNGTEYYL